MISILSNQILQAPNAFMLTLGVLAVTPAYMGVGAGAGWPVSSRSVRATAWPSLSNEIRHWGGFGLKFLNTLPNGISLSGPINVCQKSAHSPQTTNTVPRFVCHHIKTCSLELLNGAQTSNNSPLATVSG